MSGQNPFVIATVPLGEVFPTKESAVGTINHMQLKIYGSRVEAYLNGMPVDSRNAGSRLTKLNAGRVGFRAYQDRESFYADNLMVRDAQGNVLFSDDFSDPAVRNFTGWEAGYGESSTIGKIAAVVVCMHHIYGYCPSGNRPDAAP